MVRTKKTARKERNDSNPLDQPMKSIEDNIEAREEGNEEGATVHEDSHVQEEPHEEEEEPTVKVSKITKKKKKQPPTARKGKEVQPSLLFAFEHHIAHKIWNSTAPRGEARIVKIHSHVGTQRLWALDDECKFVRDVVMRSGLYQLILHAHDKLDKVLINAFIERYYPETNTFHLPFGEMMITIDEVIHITGLPAEGRVVTGPLGGSRIISYDDVYGLLEKHFGVGRPDAIMIMGGEKIRLEWLRREFEGSTEEDTDKHKKQCATAYLLYTIGCLVCGDKSGNKVSVHFLQCLDDLGAVHTYSWATACLSWLMYSLGQRTRKDVQQFSGCMTLLQVWIFEHFPVLRRHNRCVGAVDGDVRASFYFAIDQAQNLASDLVNLRERIDDLTERDVVWDCYQGKREAYKLEQYALYNGPIVCFETVELYLPQRALRQFGYFQPIPTSTFLMKFKSTTKSFRTAYRNVQELGWAEWSNHVLNDSLTSKRVERPWDCDDRYMQWYKSVSHPLVANPKNRVTEPINESDNIGLLIRIQKRLRHITEFVRSCDLDEKMKKQVLDKIEQIEGPEPMELYGETVKRKLVQEAGPSKPKRKKVVASKRVVKK